MMMGKKIVLILILGLTTSGTFGKISSVETIEHNTVKRQLPNMAGELRGREARTAPMVRHTSPAVSGSFSAPGRERGISWKP